MAVPRAGRGLRVVLHGEHGPALDRDALVGAVEEGDVALDHTLGQRRGIDHEAVVLAGDLDLAGGEVLHRVVGATVAALHLGGLGAEGEREDLVAEADAERSEEHTSELQSLMRISYAVFFLK